MMASRIKICRTYTLFFGHLLVCLNAYHTKKIRIKNDKNEEVAMADGFNNKNIICTERHAHV